MKVLFDDVYYCIEFNDKELIFENSFHFNEALYAILTPRQIEVFVGDCTKREFKVSESRAKKAKGIYKKSIWKRK